MENEDKDKAPSVDLEGGEDHLNLDDDFDNQGQPNFDDEGGFPGGDSEDADSANNDEDDDIPVPKKNSGSKPKTDAVKGDKLENQPYDLAVDVNDSEEIESDEEDDEVNMNDV